MRLIFTHTLDDAGADLLFFGVGEDDIRDDGFDVRGKECDHRDAALSGVLFEFFVCEFIDVELE